MARYAVTDVDLSAVGLQCRTLPATVIRIVFRPEMVPQGTRSPSPKDAEGMFALYLTARLPGKDHEAYRKFLKGALANARTHSGRTGRASAVAAAQGVVSFVRAIQALERSS